MTTYTDDDTPLKPPAFIKGFSQMLQKVNPNLNEITEPFLTEFGWHILEVLGTRVEDKTDERVEDQAFSYLFNRKFEEELESHLQELRAEAFVEIKEFD